MLSSNVKPLACIFIIQKLEMVEQKSGRKQLLQHQELGVLCLNIISNISIRFAHGIARLVIFSAAINQLETENGPS